MIQNNSIYHYGIGHLDGGHSGRYPWGSGKKPKQLHPENWAKIRRTDRYRYSKKQKDHRLKEGETLNTLSFDENRTKNTDMFFAAYTKTDKHHYRAYFAKSKAPKPILDENGNVISHEAEYKFQIKNKLTKSLNVAGEDSGVKVFQALYKKDAYFRRFINDPKNLGSMLHNRMNFRAYREAGKALENIRRDPKNVSDKDLRLVYRLFNYAIPNDGNGNEKVGEVVKRQRAKFFNELKNQGYSGVLDTNDTLYGGYHADAAVIVFDVEPLIREEVKRLTSFDSTYSKLVYSGRKLLGI
jgi:hypothetical protein